MSATDFSGRSSLRGYLPSNKSRWFFNNKEDETPTRNLPAAFTEQQKAPSDGQHRLSGEVGQKSDRKMKTSKSLPKETTDRLSSLSTTTSPHQTTDETETEGWTGTHSRRAQRSSPLSSTLPAFPPTCMSEDFDENMTVLELARRRSARKRASTVGTTFEAHYGQKLEIENTTGLLDVIRQVSEVKKEKSAEAVSAAAPKPKQQQQPHSSLAAPFRERRSVSPALEIAVDEEEGPKAEGLLATPVTPFQRWSPRLQFPSTEFEFSP
uniref:Uncharacterized protein n=1 Tax=Chromera velia CCMP2878 TaxID=1169474 RepID=A0A0G4G114_9ALVE|eukprot:Cvel_19619.t1-p1 / transcript=Cvel_19619.t1 / gene=Cvel_19619 / organism=Chromera_velia_CCMP2878 / gene_product=hypothetical protein / transcript_product=hypothetical protein / location=Cvel_scaffold1706:37866-39850(-) / protein_length=265 / sequence_SO=supercontig / SO=protein_coding / is_pseudo=false